MLVDFDLCDNDCGLIEFLVGANLCMGLLIDDTDKNIELFQNHARRNNREFFFQYIVI